MADPDALKAFRASLNSARQAAGSTTEQPSDLIGEMSADAAQRALPYANMARERKFRADLNQIDDPEVRSQVRESAEGAIQNLHDVRRGAFREALSAERRGDTSTAEALRENTRQAAQGGGENPVVSTAKYGGRLLFKALDAPHHLVRQLTTKVFGDEPHKLYEKDISAPEWTEGVRKVAEKGGAKGALASAALAVPRAFGVTVGGPIGATLGALGAATDLPGLLRGERSGADVIRNAGQTMKDTVKDVTDLGLTIETDPLSYVSGGIEGVGKTAAGAALRAGVEHGLERAAAEQLAEKVGMLGSRIAGKPNAFKAVEETFAKHFARAGLSDDLGRSAAQKAFGSGGEFFGRGQLALHGPMMSNISKPIAPMLGGQDFAIGKALKRVADPVLEKMGGRRLFDPTMPAVKVLQRGARGAASLGEAHSAADLEHALGQLPEGHQLHDPEIRRAIEERHADPGWRETMVDPNASVEDFRQLVNDVGERRIKEHAGNVFRLDPKENYVPAEKLDEVFGPGARQYAASLNEWHASRAQELVESGALGQDKLQANPISGLYRKRMFDPKSGALADVIGENYRSGPGQSASLRPRAQKGLLSPEWATEQGLASRETDYMKVAPQYGREAARASARSRFEKQVIDQFGVTDEIASKLNVTAKEVGVNKAGKKVFLPADVYNAMRGTFDSSLRTMASGLRSAGMGTTPAGRGVLGVLDWYANQSRRFKSLVLKTPAYHAVNLVDDLVKMASSGMHNPAKYIAKANTIMREGAIEAGGRRVTLQQANLHNIGVDAAQRFEQTGPRAVEKRLKYALEESAGKVSLGTKLKSGAAKVNDLSNDIGQGWENRAKLAHWLWRIDQGDSPAIAAKKTFDVLIDYGDKSRLEHMLGWFVPFLKFAKESPVVTAKLAASNPGAFNVLDRSLTFLNEHNQNEPPRYVTERGSYNQLTPRGAEVLGNLRELLGGSKAKKGLSYGIVPRLTQYEGLSPLVELARGNPDPVAMMGGPLIKAGVEMTAEQDLLTKSKMRRPDSFFDWFPAETPYVPKRLKADVGENPWLSRYVPSFVMSPGPLLGINTMLNRAQNGTGPNSYLGGSRPYSGRQDPKDTLSLAALKYLVGQPAYETTPADIVKNAASMPEVQSALADMAAAKKSKKLERKAARRAK